MTESRAAVGMCFDRTFPPPLVTEFARRLDDGGADQLWVIEDCFFTAGVSLAASALAVTQRLSVGIGILPGVARNAAVSAMEIATLCGLAPGRLLPGIGHGVQSWMQQMGVRPASPVTTLEEVLVAVRRLLDGERVTMHGSYVHLEDVQLAQPPADPPPVLAGVRGPKSLAMAGRVAGGVVLAEPGSPSYVRWALEQCGHPTGFHAAVFAMLCIEDDRAGAYQSMAPWLASVLDDPNVGLRVLPFFDDLMLYYSRHGVSGLVTMPPAWWREILGHGRAAGDTRTPPHCVLRDARRLCARLRGVHAARRCRCASCTRASGPIPRKPATLIDLRYAPAAGDAPVSGTAGRAAPRAPPISLASSSSSWSGQ